MTSGTIHGRSYEPEHRVWRNMRTRCNDPERAHIYGHVTVCARWASYEAFLADVGRKPYPKATLDRIDPSGNYEPGNVRWASTTEQARNRRVRKNNRSGAPGVSWSARPGKWRVRIRAGGVNYEVGYFDDFPAAVAARAEAQKALWAN